jgi:hypothetical protein
MEETLRLFLLDAARLLRARQLIYEGDERTGAADERLLEEAAGALEMGPYSVVDKDELPPSGDRRDYMSLAPYWWPDPEREDGLPYVRRDGEVNEEREHCDSAPLAAMCSAVNTLATAYFFSDHEDFAARAALFMRTFFLDETTRMNPHLQYSQAIRGHCDGRGIGIIDTHSFSWLVDSIGFLQASASWNSDDQAGIISWFSTYVDWLLESAYGREEAAQKNNHGTCYDVQVAALALFCGRDEVARDALQRVPERIAAQVEPDGRQPLELARTRSLSYSVMNLTAFFDLADLGRHLGMDWWVYESEQGQSIRRAFYWLVENGIEVEEWSSEQIAPFNVAQWMPLLRRGGMHFEDRACEEYIAALQGVEVAAERTNLLYFVL